MNLALIWDKNDKAVEEICQTMGISVSDDSFNSLDELKNNKMVSFKDAILVLLDTDLDGYKRKSHL